MVEKACVRLRVVIGLIVLMMGLSSERADARFRVCNQMNQRLSVAFGYVDRTRGWVAQGWWVINADQCTNIYEADLDNRYYYVLAEPTGGGAPLKGGKVAFCIQDTSFLLYQAQYGSSSPEDCAKAGLRSAAFISIDVGAGQKNHLLNFTGNAPSSASVAAPAPPPVAAAPPPPRPPVAEAPRPVAPPAAPGGGAGTACQRYPNLC